MRTCRIIDRRGRRHRWNVTARHNAATGCAGGRHITLHYSTLHIRMRWRERHYITLQYITHQDALEGGEWAPTRRATRPRSQSQRCSPSPSSHRRRRRHVKIRQVGWSFGSHHRTTRSTVTAAATTHNNAQQHHSSSNNSNNDAQQHHSSSSSKNRPR